ncbi:hypothetical protein [Shouchella patagoniensis]|uniref:hypothetical protein n=1 Tax=Shouchella patagoniensis TaxID=228576 RepID=UPI000994BE3F|nr:hypothetical protein [Shouchella patagoniensis]
MTDENKNHNQKDHSVANAIVGGVCGVTLGWFYKQEAGQALISRIKESELARNIGADIAKSTQEHLTEYVTTNLKAKTEELLSSSDESNEEAKAETETASIDRDAKHEELAKENQRLEEMIRRLEEKMDKQADQ